MGQELRHRLTERRILPIRHRAQEVLDERDVHVVVHFHAREHARESDHPAGPVPWNIWTHCGRALASVSPSRARKSA